MDEVVLFVLSTIKKTASLAVTFFVTTYIWSQNTPSFSPGPHGGTVKPARSFYIEVINSYENLYAFLLDENTHPIKNKGITCVSRFYFPDSAFFDVQLLPHEDEGFMAENITSAYLLCRITFHLSGTTVSAVFENNPVIVKE